MKEPWEWTVGECCLTKHSATVSHITLCPLRRSQTKNQGIELPPPCTDRETEARYPFSRSNLRTRTVSPSTGHLFTLCQSLEGPKAPLGWVSGLLPRGGYPTLPASWNSLLTCCPHFPLTAEFRDTWDPSHVSSESSLGIKEGSRDRCLPKACSLTGNQRFKNWPK